MAEERRLVTVLFADVAGSTELGEALDPEDLRHLLSRYYSLAKDTVSSHGGTVEKFIGDAVMAVFGLPVAHGDDAARALSAAMELRERVRSDVQLADRIPIRIGINSGEVVATRDGGGGDFLITGDAVNVAARLQQSAERWQILCGERTVQAARATFTFGPFATLAAKGKAGGVRAAEVTGRGAGRERMRVPLIGRATDLAQLEIAAKRALDERRPQLVSVIAPAGTGKTRLLEEFLDGLAGMTPDAVVALAQCLPYGQRLTYWPMRNVLFRLIGVTEDAQPDEIRGATRRWLRDARVEDAETVAAQLEATVGAGAEAVDKAALLSAWRTALEVAARERPLVIVFEDLHWSSDSLLDLVEFVMQPRGDSRVLTIALTRPELLDRRPQWGGGRRNYVALALEPLPDDAVATLVEHLLESPSRAIVERVVARAEGNPFYAGELVRSLVERVSSLADPAAVERALAELPDTVQATVLARLDLLRPAERRVLQLGAVLGRTFRGVGVSSLAPELTPEIDAIVDVLLDKDLVRVAEPGRYTFRHILIREVAYQTLPRAERARLHAAAGRWLEAFAAGREDAYAELIAYHWREAASLASALEDAEHVAAIRAKAAHWLVRAGDAAIAGAANMEAARHLYAAIDFSAPSATPELWERIGLAHPSGQESLRAFENALRVARETSRPTDDQLRFLAGMLEVHMRFQGSAGRPSQAEMNALRGQGREMLKTAGDPTAIGRFLAADAFFPFWTQFYGPPSDEELAGAERSARDALAIAERLGDLRLQSAALDGIGGVVGIRGDHAQSRDHALRRLRMSGLPLTERLDAYSVAAWMSTWSGELDEAERISQIGLTEVQPGQTPAWALALAAWRTYVLSLLGRWDESLAAAERARSLWFDAERLNAGYALFGFVAALWIARARGLDAVETRAREVIEPVSAAFPLGSPQRAIATGFVFLDIESLHRIAGRFRPPAQILDQAIAFATDAGTPPPADLCRAVLDAPPAVPLVEPQARRALGVLAGDERELARAVELFDGMGALPYAARARIERALITGDERLYDEGTRRLEALGDQQQLARYEQRRRR